MVENIHCRLELTKGRSSLLLFLFFTTQAYSSPIDNINFIGLNTTSDIDIKKVLTFIAGQEFSSTSCDQIINELFETGYFSDIKIDIYSLSDQQKKPTLKTDDIRNNDAKDIASELLEIIEKKIKTEEKLHSEINALKRELSFLRDKVESQQWSSTRNFT
jgi:outer membrane protein assembly factor BamA